MSKADIGLIGLAVMGQNLVLNMEDHGYTVAVFNRTVEKVDKFIAGRGAGKNFIGCQSIEEILNDFAVTAPFQHQRPVEQRVFTCEYRHTGSHVQKNPFGVRLESIFQQHSLRFFDHTHVQIIHIRKVIIDRG